MITPEGPSAPPGAEQATAGDLEQAVSRFEAAWREGRPALEEYLPASGPGRLAALVELAHTDLEYRLRAGLPARVESYLERFPELTDNRAAVLGLIRTEYALRRRQE